MPKIYLFLEKFSVATSTDYVDLYSVAVNYTLGAKIGFEKIGVRKDWYLHQQEWIDELNYQLIFD